jgi:hypothetical protein
MYIFLNYESDYYMRVLRQSFLHLPVGTVCKCRTYFKQSISFQFYYPSSCLPLRYDITLLVCTTLVAFGLWLMLRRQAKLPCRRISGVNASCPLAPLALTLQARPLVFPQPKMFVGLNEFNAFAP